VLSFLSLILITSHLSRRQRSTIQIFERKRDAGVETAEDVKQKLYNANFTKYCEDYGEWEMLVTRRAYVKRTAAFYFIDADIFRVQILVRGESLPLRTFHLRINFLKHHKIVETQFVNDSDIHYHNEEPEFVYMTRLIETRLKTRKNYPNSSYDSMTVTVIDEATKLETAPLVVKIKYLLGDRATKKSMMHCGKCINLSVKEDLADLEWDIKLQKKIGYDKKYICMIEQNEGFKRLFNEYRDFLEIGELKCIPNLQDHALLLNQSYLAKHTDLRDKNYNYMVRKFDVINVLISNECYMNNIEKYRFINVGDNDEILLPKLIESMMTLDSVQSYIAGIEDATFEKHDPFLSVSCNGNVKLESYLDRLLAPQSTYNNLTSFHFKYGTYFFNDMVKEFFQLLEIKLKEHFIWAKTRRNDTMTQSIIVNLTYVSFSIGNLKELQYANSLLKVYKSYVEPLFSKLGNETNRAGNFNKMFFVTGSANDYYPGKSIINTRRSMDSFIHWSASIIEISEDKKNVSVWHDWGNWGRLELVSSPNVAHMSHFRKGSLRFDQMARIVSISSFHFDLNYLKCYFLPGIHTEANIY
jgi:hypothetical protein